MGVVVDGEAVARCAGGLVVVQMSSSLAVLLWSLVSVPVASEGVILFFCGGSRVGDTMGVVACRGVGRDGLALVILSAKRCNRWVWFWCWFSGGGAIGLLVGLGGCWGGWITGGGSRSVGKPG